MNTWEISTQTFSVITLFFIFPLSFHFCDFCPQSLSSYLTKHPESPCRIGLSVTTCTHGLRSIPVGQFEDFMPFPSEHCSTDSSPADTGEVHKAVLSETWMYFGVTAHLDERDCRLYLKMKFPLKNGVSVGQWSTNSLSCICNHCRRERKCWITDLFSLELPKPWDLTWWSHSEDLCLLFQNLAFKDQLWQRPRKHNFWIVCLRNSWPGKKQ